jgi:GDP/UDP-N,N'-diacetylbacillosamine 2-epimerase (hydrolysing)
MKRVCVVTGTRAEYGLLRSVMERIQRSPLLTLQIITTGMHLAPEFGRTEDYIVNDGFVIDRRVEMLLSSDTNIGTAKSIGLGILGFADYLADLKPDLLIVLGDRFEILSAATAAMILGIPIAHIHGGEVTEGAFDDSIRHALTKMAHFHFVAAEDYRRRVVQLGEHPDNVFLVGALGIDCIHKTELLDRKALEESLSFGLGDKSLLVTYHPVTLERSTNAQTLNELLSVLSGMNDTRLIFTMPNADAEGRTLSNLIRTFCSHNPNAKCFESLGQVRYLSCLKHVDGVIGNSSSGIIEAPSLKKGSVNIGSRQKGRLRATSIIDCEPNSTDIKKAIAKLFSAEFQATLPATINPYGHGGASESIVAIIEQKTHETIEKKQFYDLPQYGSEKRK